jgi:hypothetical protein
MALPVSWSSFDAKKHDKNTVISNAAMQASRGHDAPDLHSTSSLATGWWKDEPAFGRRPLTTAGDSQGRASRDRDADIAGPDCDLCAAYRKATKGPIDTCVAVGGHK